MIDVVTVRDPDFSNETTVFGDDHGEVLVIDIDLGASDLSARGEWLEWVESMHGRYADVRSGGAAALIAETVLAAAEKFGHTDPLWALPEAVAEDVAVLNGHASLGSKLAGLDREDIDDIVAALDFAATEKHHEAEKGDLSDEERTGLRDEARRCSLLFERLVALVSEADRGGAAADPDGPVPVAADTYAVVVLEVLSDTPGIDRAFGPFATYEEADARRMEERGELIHQENAELVQVTRLDREGRPVTLLDQLLAGTYVPPSERSAWEHAFGGDAGAALIRDTLVDRGNPVAAVEEAMLDYQAGAGGEGDFWNDFVGPMIDAAGRAVGLEQS